MEELLGNYDVLERLVQFLPVPDLVKLVSVGRELRDILGGELVWRRVARRQGAERENDYLVREYDEYVGCSNKAGLEPLCRSFFVTVYPAYLRRRWRSHSFPPPRRQGWGASSPSLLTNMFLVHHA